MKRLTKLNINPEKVMKNEELISLRGGTNPCDGQEGTCGFFCYEPGGFGTGRGGCCMEKGHMEAERDALAAIGWSCNWCCDHCYESSYCNNYY
jgi:hypothetical protein